MKIEFISGWHKEEADEFHSYRWMKKEASIKIANLKIGGDQYLILVGGHPFQETKNPTLKIRINGKSIGKVKILPSTNTYLFPLKIASSKANIELIVDRVFEKEKGTDPRELGIIVDSIRILAERDIKDPLFSKGWSLVRGNDEARMLLLNQNGEMQIFNLKRREIKYFSFCINCILYGAQCSLYIKSDHYSKKKLKLKEGLNEFLLPFNSKRDKKNVRFSIKTDSFERKLDGIPYGVLYGIRLYGIKAKEIPLPVSLELETTTYCDINPPCVMCYTRVLHTRDVENENLDEEVFKKLIPYFKNFSIISLHGIGEPLIGKKLFTILDSIDTNKTKVQFNTNGLKLNEEKSKTLIEKGLKLINFSIDAATPETYRKIRGIDFHQVIGNIKKLTELKLKKKSKYPVIEMNMTLMKENLNEAFQFIHLAKELGAEIVHFGVLNKAPDYTVQNQDFTFRYHQQMLDLNSTEFIKQMKRARRNAEKNKIEFFLEIPKDLKS